MILKSYPVLKDCLENNFQIPPNPPLLKGGEGGFDIVLKE